jgi:hypothetical protein
MTITFPLLIGEFPDGTAGAGAMPSFGTIFQALGILA